jgi:hypothetical protein
LPLASLSEFGIRRDEEVISLHLDNAQKKLMRELVTALHETLLKSDHVAEAVYNVRAAGLEVRLSLNGTINVSSWPQQAVNVRGQPFLEFMRVGVDFDNDAPK